MVLCAPCMRVDRVEYIAELPASQHSITLLNSLPTTNMNQPSHGNNHTQPGPINADGPMI